MDVEDAYNPQQLIDEDADGDEDIDVEMWNCLCKLH